MNEKRANGWLVCLVGCCVAALAGCNALLGVIGDDVPGSAIPNDAPTALADVDPSARTGEPVVFNASASLDSDGDVVSYDWNFGDGSSSDVSVVEHVFDEAGEYTVRLTVEDDRGATDTLVFTIVVAESEVPTATLAVVVEPMGTGRVMFDPPEGVYEIGVSVTITATPADGFLFDAFVDATGIAVSTDPVYILTIEDDATLIARFIPDEPNVFSLSVTVSPAEAGTVERTPADAEYEAGTLVTLTALPNTGYEFARFSGDVSSTSTTADVIMNADKTIVAEFALKTVAVSVNIDPPGAGSARVDPAGGVYGYGTILTLTANAASGFVFDRFVDIDGVTLSTQSPFSFLAEENQAITARFTNAVTPTFTLGVSVVPSGGGSVTLDPAGGVYNQNTIVTITATPSVGYAFLTYSGDASGTVKVVTVLMDADKAVTAEFEWSPAIGNPGNLLVTGFVGKNVTEFDRFDGTLLGEVVAGESGGLSFAAGIDVGPDGNIYVVSAGIVSNTSVLRYDGLTGEFMDMFVDGGDTVGFFTLRFGPNGNLLVPDSNDDSISEYDGTTGALVREFVAPGAGGLDNPLGLRFGPNGNLFVASKNSDAVIEFDGTTGATVGTYADLDAAGFTVPVDLLFNQAGDMFVAVSGNESVVRVDATGSVTTFIASGDGGLDSPGGVLFHPDSGNLLVVSQGTNEVLEYDGATGAFLGIYATGAVDDSLIFTAFRPN